MEKSKILFWNVDTQVDFIEPQGKLYVKGAETLKPVYKQITGFAKAEGLRVVNTCDYHFSGTAELSKNPDYISTFPEHCMAGTPGAEFIAETNPENPDIYDWKNKDEDFSLLDDINQSRNIVIRKDAFDVFAGSPHTVQILNILRPQKVFVYGVTTNICVDQAVMGLSRMGKKVYVFEDAIKELPNIPLPFNNWKQRGIELISFSNISKYF